MKNYSVDDFCAAAGISRSLFYKAIRDGWGPAIVKLGRKTIITTEAAQAWLKSMEERSNV